MIKRKISFIALSLFWTIVSHGIARSQTTDGSTPFELYEKCFSEANIHHEIKSARSDGQIILFTCRGSIAQRFYLLLSKSIDQTYQGNSSDGVRWRVFYTDGKENQDHCRSRQKEENDISPPEYICNFYAPSTVSGVGHPDEFITCYSNALSYMPVRPDGERLIFPCQSPDAKSFFDLLAANDTPIITSKVDGYVQTFRYIDSARSNPDGCYSRIDITESGRSPVYWCVLYFRAGKFLQ